MNTKQLKQKILSLAITGRLVPQDPSDESASELIYRINSKATMVQGDAPFDVPDSWSWCRLGRVCDIARGGSPRPIKKYLTDAENGVNWIKIGDTKPDDKYVRSVKQKIKPEGVSRSRFVHKGDFLLTNSMSFGRPYILDVDGCIHDGWLVISPKGGVYDKDFLYYLLSSPFAYEQFSREAGGGVVDNLNSEKVSNTVFPLPPLSEQRRIANAVERWFAKIDQLEHDCETLSKFGKQVRKKLLTAAIAGRLVQQNPNDEPASELLHRINPKATPLQDDVPYEIPDSWAWCRIKDVFIINPKNKVADETEAGFVPMGNISGGFSDDFKAEIKKWKDIRHNFTHFANGDIAVAKISPCLENRKSMILRGLPNGIGAGTTELHVFRPLCVVPKFFLYFAKTDYFINKCTSDFSGTVGQKRAGRAVVASVFFPLPPLAEQKRIVEKLEAMFAVLDNLDTLTA